ncbi:MAG: transporter substrate-binding domain-containing protein [Mesorhizobium sp.]
MTPSMRIAPVLLALLVACVPAAAKDAAGLRIATEGAFPPFSDVTADGEVRGFDVDIANALCAHMQVTCEIVTQDWDGLIPGLQAGKFDVIVASMTITEERRKQVAFTHRYYSTPLALVARKDSGLAGIEPAALAGRALGAQAASVHADYAQSVYGRAGADVKLYPSVDEVLMDLANGRLDAAISDKFALVDWMRKSDRDCCEIAGTLKDSETHAGIAVRLDDQALRNRLDAALDAVLADGTYRTIQARYFDFDIY